MNNQSFSLTNRPAGRIGHSPKPNDGVLAWRWYRTKNIANFTREVNNFPNTTISINVGSSAGWVEQLAGITNVTVGVASGSAITGKIGVNQIVGTGLFLEGTKRISFGQAAHFVTGFVEEFDPGYYGGNVVYGKTETMTLFANVQQLTMVEPIGAAKYAQFAVAREYSLSDQLRRLRKLPDGWDGEGAPRISEATCETAETVIKGMFQLALSHLAVPTTLLGPLPDGSLRFECICADKELFLTISDNAVEVQAWQPRDTVESSGYWETGPAGAMEYLEWLVK
jgi:hypothetical protein